MEICIRPGCGRSAFRNTKGNFCSRGCRDLPAGAPAPQTVLCVKPGCGFPAYNGVEGNFCCKSCRRGCSCSCVDSRTLQVAALGPSPARAVDGGGAGGPPASCQQLGPTDSEYQSVMSQLTTKWDTSRMQIPSRMTLFKITVSKIITDLFRQMCTSIGHCTTYGCGKTPGNRQRRFHGTYLRCQFSGQACGNAGCPVCGILLNGFQIAFLGQNTGNGGYFGAGHYSTSSSSSAYGFAQSGQGGRSGATLAVLVCVVAVGNAEILQVTSGSQMAAQPKPGCHSRVIEKSSGVDELMVPDGQQMLPQYLIIFG